MSFLEIVKQNCEFDRMMLNRVKEIPQPRIEGRLKLRTKGGHNQTYIKLKGDDNYKYAAKSDGETQGKVNRLKLKYFLDMSRNVLEGNVQLQKHFIENYVPYSFEHVNEMLAPAYRYEQPQRIFSNVDRQSQNPYRRDLLIHMTNAGIFVRSKGEIVVTDTLVGIGADFYYERALELIDEHGRKRIVYPDFLVRNVYLHIKESHFLRGRVLKKAPFIIVEISISQDFTYWRMEIFCRETSVKHSKIHEKVLKKRNLRVNIHFCINEKE